MLKSLRLLFQQIFQSTLPRRERLIKTLPLFLLLIYFNPHSHEGSDLPVPVFLSDLFKFQSTLPRRERPRTFVNALITQSISIHTPTKGATKHLMMVSWSYVNFNPHSHEGSDNDDEYQWIPESRFQSTLPRRERHGDKVLIVQINDISIHTPTKGATFLPYIQKQEMTISIHTPTKGATV